MLLVESCSYAKQVLTFQLVLNPSAQAASLTKGLEYISNVIVRSSMRENLYFHRWEQNVDEHSREAFLPTHQEYRDTLKELYVRVLKFQATSICYYSKHGALRVGLDVIKWDNWDSLLEEVQNQDSTFRQAYDILNDSREEEKFETI